MAEVDAWNLKLHWQVLGFLVQVACAAHGHVASHHQLHFRLQRPAWSGRGGLHEHVGLLLVPGGFGQDEVEAELVGLLGLEDIGIVTARRTVLHDAQDVAGVGNLTFQQRYVELTVELAVLEVVLDECEVDVVERETPSTQLTRFGTEHVFGIKLQGCSTLVEEHVVGGDGQPLVAARAHFQRFRKFHTYGLDVQTLPVGVVPSGHASLALLIVGWETTHLG